MLASQVYLGEGVVIRLFVNKPAGTVSARVLTLAVAALIAGAACGDKHPAKTDGGDGGRSDADAKTDTASGDGPLGDAQGDTIACPTPSSKLTGDACTCSGECASGFCVEGVCCTSACTDGCKTCAADGMAGSCVNLPAGSDPRTASTCLAEAASTCGRDGKCDGAGACRRHVPGTVCRAGSCENDAVVGENVCTSDGQCRPGPTEICAPFSCDSTKQQCFSTCVASTQCVSGHQCQSGSCGKKMKGAHCENDTECASGFCADKVCCNVACKGACVKCDLPMRQGSCFPVEAGLPDPRGICTDQGPESCGRSGTCDGVAGCAKYPRDTLCEKPSCAGNKVNTARTCDGLGTCRTANLNNCSPFRCANGACTDSCQSDGDCDTDRSCLNGTCGLKKLGQSCTTGPQCEKGNCVDGVCCESACTGACLSCALPSSPGMCVALAAGTVDSRGVCKDNGARSCGTDGKCDGSGSCETYARGTRCAEESCTGNVYTPPSTCNSSGQCVAPDALPCRPFVCNGTRCFNACTTNTQCLPPNSCNNNSCGPSPPGASCQTPEQCDTGICQQGTCCRTTCTGPCRDCSLSGSLGTCSPVLSGTDPAGMCADRGAMSCGTNGKCEAGACQRYAMSTACADPTCPSATTTSTATSTCDGAGTCVKPGAISCFPYLCGAGACKNSCTADRDCSAPAVCINGSCGRKPNGLPCANDNNECSSGFCVQGVCCGSACTEKCKSCSLLGSMGTCTNITNGSPDPKQMCADMGPASCSTDGFCDGNGGCRLYDAATSCAAPTCPAGTTTATSGRTCDGRGVCQPATTLGCAPYVCNGTTACKGACTGDADCLLPAICDPLTNLCGNRFRLGQSCTATADCLTSASCVDGVCCSASACPTCQACNVMGSAGNCTNVPLNAAEPHGLCSLNPPCGNTGACNGAGACQVSGTGVACGIASCTGTTSTPISHCNGSGGCAAPTSSSCIPYICGPNACKTTCAVDGDCVAPTTCQSGNCALKANGVSCTASSQCISGHCTDGVCCGTASCPNCQACNLNGAGSCSNVAAGQISAGCVASPPCGNTGACNGGGGCQQASTATSCGMATCTGSTLFPISHCDGAGTCAASTSSSCVPYLCGTGACKTNCQNNADCIGNSYYCTAPGGSCMPKKGNGNACGSANECGSGFCTNGVCCGVAACATCQACNVTGNAGACANVPANTADPGCAAAPPCGNTGVCNGGGACTQASTSVSCGSPSCTGSTFTAVSSCNGSGSCAAATSSSCSPYVCGNGNACRTNCQNNTDCISTSYYCTGTPGSCLPKRATGATCTAANECASGFCTDGICCGAGSCPTCQSCNVAGNLGTCADAPAGSSDSACTANPPCGNTGTCNGAGACTQAASSVACGTTTCTGSTLSQVSQCNGSGSCAAPATSSCVPYNCGTNACKTSCQNNADCISNSYYCTAPGGICQPKKSNGMACGVANECGSGFCTDDVCCGVAACPTCQACDVGANAGACANVASGIADARCTPAPPCGNTGICNGAGACTQAASSVQCGNASCSATTYTPPAFCSGSGSCSNPGTQSCAPYVCGTNACRVDCSSDGQCTGGNYCTGSGGSCVPKKGPGASCMAGNECGTGNCVDGVCCSSPSCPTCQACNVGGSAGICANVGAGAAEPHARCTASPPCGNTGACDGAGTCEEASASIQCGGSSCSGSTHTLPTFCSGTGSCSAATTQSCAPYVCGTTTCRTSCTSDGDCTSGNYCNPSAMCVAKKAAGATCSGDDECGTGNCVDNTCCTTSSCGTCQACNITGNGICASVANGTSEPHGLCLTSPPCGNTGTCTGGACTQAPASMSCATPFCIGTVFHPTAFCNGSGSCSASGTQECAPYLCSSGGCTNSCDNDTECASGNYCNAGSCVAKRINGQTCTAATQCASAHCTEGYCCGSSACPSCQSCAVAGMQGTCTNVGSGDPDPTGTCVDQGRASCQRNGACNGSGGCALYDTSTVCSASCSSLTDLVSTYCDGAGTCGPATMTTTCTLVCSAGSPNDFCI